MMKYNNCKKILKGLFQKEKIEIAEISNLVQLIIFGFLSNFRLIY